MAKQSGSSKGKNKPQFEGVSNKSLISHHPFSKGEAFFYVSEDLGKDEKNSIISALDNYTGNRFQQIRSAQTEDGTFVNQDKIDAEKIEKFIDIAPKWNGGVTYRSIMVNNDVAQSILSSARNGEILNQKGMSSWTSTKSSTIDSYTNGRINIMFQCPYPQNGTSVKCFSRFPDENEILVSSNARYVATKIKEHTNHLGGPSSWTITVKPVKNKKR